MDASTESTAVHIPSLSADKTQDPAAVADVADAAADAVADAVSDAAATSSASAPASVQARQMHYKQTLFVRAFCPPMSDEPFAAKDLACILRPLESAIRESESIHAFQSWWPDSRFADPFVVAFAFLHALLASALAFVVALPVLLLSACYALPFEIAFAFAGALAVATCPAYGYSLRFFGALFVFSFSLLGGTLAVLAAAVLSPFFALFCGFESVFAFGWLSWKPVFGLHAPARALRGWVNLSVPLSCLIEAWSHWRAPRASNERIRILPVFVWIEVVVVALFGGILGIVPFSGIALLFCVPIWLRAFILALQLPKVSCALILVWPFAVALALVLASPPILFSLSLLAGFVAGAASTGGAVLAERAAQRAANPGTFLGDLGDLIKFFYEFTRDVAAGSWDLFS
jgi:hypothetical protein